MNDVLEFLQGAIEDDRKSLSEQLARGMVTSWEMYQHIAGKIAALDTVLSAIKDIQERLEKE